MKAKGTPLNILQVLEPSGGGSGRHFIDLCGELARMGHSVTAIYSPLRAEERFVRELTDLPLKSVHSVEMTRSPSPADFRSWWKINRIIRREGPFDIIHGHSSKAGALTRLRLPGNRTPRVYTPHAFRTMDPFLGRRGRQIFGSIETLFGNYLTDALICVSRDELMHAVSDLRIETDVLHLVVNGAAPPERIDRIGLRDALGLEKDAFVFGFVGRLSEQKAPERAIRAFSEIAANHPGTHLVMIGSGPQADLVRSEIEKAGLRHRIHLRPDIPGPEAMQIFDALVMPSRYEAMSYVMLEAEILGLPMILTDVGGASTVLDDGQNGFLVPNSDAIGALSNAMSNACRPDIHGRLKEAASRRMDRHTLSTMAERTETIYRMLTGGAPPSERSRISSDGRKVIAGQIDRSAEKI